MKKPSNNLIPGILIFAIGFLAALFSQFYPETKILIRITFLVSIVYLALGWYIFKRYIPEGETPVLFLMGYLYSSIFIASVFGAAGWPMSSTIITISPIWIIGQIILLVVLRKKIPKEALVQLLIESGFLLLLVIFLLVKA